jgi:hypothetical protein
MLLTGAPRDAGRSCKCTETGLKHRRCILHSYRNDTSQEAERKRVEAGGIKDFQDIVSQGISEKLLEWKGIEATMELVKSQNAKVIVVGNSKNGLPLIYSGDK